MMADTTSTTRKRRVQVYCLTYGEPAENIFAPQFEYSLNILNRLTRRVAPIPRFVTPLLAARRARIRCQTFNEKGWNSPLEKISDQQAAILEQQLRELRPDIEFTVEVLREFRPPLLPEVLEKLETDPPDDIIVMPLYVAESDFTTGISRTDFETYHNRKKGANPLPGPKYVIGFGFDERFADAMADFILRQCEKRGWDEAKCRESALILGAHGTVVTLPAGMNSGAQETGNLFRLIRKRLKDRFAWVRVGWLNHELGGMWTCPTAEESAGQAQERGLKKVVYFPFGFVGDNGESMLEGRDALAEYEWEDMLYLPCPNEDRPFLRVMAEMASERLDQPGENWETIGRGNPAYERPEMPAPREESGFLKFTGPTLAVLACLFWSAIGVWLTARGVIAGLETESTAVFVLAAIFGALIGWYKGSRILGKLAVKNLKRLRSIPQPSFVTKMFSKPSWIVIAFFACVGVSLRFVPMPLGLRAAILMGVGSAMLVGAAYYVARFRESIPIDAAIPLAPATPQEARAMTPSSVA